MQQAGTGVESGENRVSGESSVSKTNQFWQYATEAMLSACYAKTDEDALASGIGLIPHQDAYLSSVHSGVSRLLGIAAIGTDL
jgi:hypothetical protein